MTSLLATCDITKIYKIARRIRKIHFISWTASRQLKPYNSLQLIELKMACLPRPKIFRKRRKRTEGRPNTLSRFANSVAAFFSSLFVYTPAASSTASLSSSCSSGNTAVAPKKRENILKRMRQARSNRVGIMPPPKLSGLALAMAQGLFYFDLSFFIIFSHVDT